ncbi:hypothetical protein LC048_07520 [Mesobacillus subterraneus]|uniref:hypothetical protein n=1 Tax=Mesobacillus subterraneus TaxID=285983 RepID=UPI001CFDB484|nr:hypothetical protein [Mesobacillus subterraneus]WLR54614.1 hypothetical protein LC048_19665 [Mesobacillus subterraneus]WLR56253.1 hypothetical protein LC048_04810 [Mesobacillus subterraneus]WLR56723.1 hypothetical protein LC048_07520 [Mesobacillus subterraneus]
MRELLTVREATEILQSCGIECQFHEVKKWAIEGKIKAKHENRVYRIGLDDVYDFLEILWKGSSYEIGINDETKISRLIQENKEIKDRIIQLEKENKILRQKLSSLK